MFLVLAISSDSCACFTHMYGEEKLAILIDHFGGVKIDAKLEWIAMRGLLIDAAERSLTMETFYSLMIHPQLDSFPNPGQDGDSCCASAHHVSQLRARHQHVQCGKDVGQSFPEGVSRFSQPRGSIYP